MEQSTRKRRSFVAPLITLLASVVLAVGSCFGFLNTLSMDGAGKHPLLNAFFFFAFLGCAILFPATIIWIIVRATRNSRASGQGEP